MPIRFALLIATLAALPACQVALVSDDAPGSIATPKASASGTTAIPAREFVRLHGEPVAQPPRIRVRVACGDGTESAVTFERGTRLRTSLAFLLPDERLRALCKVGVYRELDEPVFVVCDVSDCNRYGDLAQDVQLADGDVVFIPEVSSSILQEFFSVCGILASE